MDRSMSRLSIRTAGPEDIALIMQLADVAFRTTYASILSPEQMEYMMDWMYSEKSLRTQICDEGKTFCVAESDGTPAGYVSYEFERMLDDGRPLYHLQKLYLLPDCQHLGYGRQMMEHVLEDLHGRHAGGCRVELNVNRGNTAVGFYEHMGLQRDRRGDFPIGNGFFMNDFIYAIDL